MRAQITRHAKRGKQFDTISVFDSDGREIAISRQDIKPLIKLLNDIRHKDTGGLNLLPYAGVIW